MGKLILHEFKIGHDSYDRLGIFLNIYALLERRLIVSEYRLTGRHTFFLLLGFLSRDIHYTRGFISKGFLLVLALEDFRSLGRKP